MSASSTPLTLLQLFELPPLLPGAQARLDSAYRVLHLWQAADPQAMLRAEGAGVHVLLTSAFAPVTAALIDSLPQLQAICNLGVGYDHIDVAHAAKRGVQVSNTPDVLNDCVADLTWGLILATLRGMGRAERYVRSAQWQSRLASVPLGRRVTGSKLGIVGLGRVGQAVAQRAAGFSMPVRYHNRRARTDVPWEYEPSLHELARWADVLVVATVGGPTTHHLIDAEVLQALGPQSYLINVARGPVVDEAALALALEQGVIAGAGLDVFEQEPVVHANLLTQEHAVLMPHIGSATAETRRDMLELTVANAERYAASGELLTPVRV